MSSNAESLLDNDTLANASNTSLSGREAATFEGLMTAYGALLLMAAVPIYVGSLRSIAYHADLKASVGCRVCCVRARAAPTPLLAPTSVYLYLSKKI